MQLAIQLVSHNTILVSSRPGCHADGYAAEIVSPGPKLLATLRDWPCPQAESWTGPRLAAMQF